MDDMWLAAVRHGESTANVAATSAARDEIDLIDIAEREADVPLSALGQQQARSLERRFAAMDESQRPDLIVTSPFLRAKQTAEIAVGSLDVRTRVDERLRDRDLGILDLHTAQGIRSMFPEESERRRRHGKFYYRPPGGESWTDVALRLRAVLREIEQDAPGRRIVLFAHDVVVTLVRYVLEDLDEAAIAEAAAASPIANASLSSWNRVEGVWQPETYNDVSHIDDDEHVRTTQEEPVDEPA